MARYVNRFELYPGAIQAHFDGTTGMVSGHANVVLGRAVAKAKLLAPKRTGNLAKSIEPGYLPVGNLRYGIAMTAVAHYAPFVLMGTHSPITPFTHRFMKLPSTRMGGKFIYRQYVRGQAANNFLATAMASELAIGGYIFR